MRAFIAAISRQVGSHLEELSLCVTDVAYKDILVFLSKVSLTRGRVLLTGFKRLRVLKLLVELVTCNINAQAVEDKTTYTQ